MFLLYLNLRTAAFPAGSISGRHGAVPWGGRQHPIPLPALPEPPSCPVPSRLVPSRAEPSRAGGAQGGCRGGRAAAWKLIHLPGCQSINQRIQKSGNGWDNMYLRKICVHTTSTQDGNNYMKMF